MVLLKRMPVCGSLCVVTGTRLADCASRMVDKIQVKAKA